MNKETIKEISERIRKLECKIHQQHPKVSDELKDFECCCDEFFEEVRNEVIRLMSPSIKEELKSGILNSFKPKH